MKNNKGHIHLKRTHFKEDTRILKIVFLLGEKLRYIFIRKCIRKDINLFVFGEEKNKMRNIHQKNKEKRLHFSGKYIENSILTNQSTG